MLLTLTNFTMEQKKEKIIVSKLWLLIEFSDNEHLSAVKLEHLQAFIQN